MNIYIRLPKELRQTLADCIQDPIFHNSNSVEVHTLQVLERAIEYFPDDIDMHLAAIFHDLGKPETREVSTRPDGTERIKHIGHEFLAEKFIDQYIHLFADLKPNIDKIKAICKNHMRAHLYNNDTIKKHEKRIAFETQPYAIDIINFAKLCDKNGI